MEIIEITDPRSKKAISRSILESLTEWFGIEESREEYIEGSSACPFFAAYAGSIPAGFICLRKTGKDTAEIYVLGVLEEYHRKGIGRRLFEAAREAAREAGFSFLQVKTVQMGRYPCYDATNRFYLSVGFKEFQVFPDLWDRNNPCQIYVMAL